MEGIAPWRELCSKLCFNMSKLIHKIAGGKFINYFSKQIIFEHPQAGEKASIYLQIIDMLILDNSLGIKQNLLCTTVMVVL